MAEYAYVHESFDEDDTVDIPDQALGVTVETFGKLGKPGMTVHVRYLLPVSEVDDG